VRIEFRWVLAVFIILALSASLQPLAYVTSVATLREPYIVLPSYLLPAVVKPGELLNVSVRGADDLKVLGAHLYGVRGSSQLTLEGVSGGVISVDPRYSFEVLVLTFRLPSDVQDGLYNVVILSDRGPLWMPNSVVVDRGGGPRGVIRVVQLTDIHFGAEQGGYPNNFKHTRYVALLNTLIDRLGVNLVVYTGDLIDVGTDIRSYRDFFMVTSQVLAPQLAITGNHDWAQVDSTRLLVERFYGRYVVPLRVWSFVYGDFLFVGLDTRMEGYPEMWQLDYLERVVSQHGDKSVVILMHHPLFTNAGEYRGKPEDIRRYIYSSWREAGWDAAVRLLSIVEKYKNVVAVLAGHVHRDADAVYVRSDGSRVYFITTTTANHGYPEGYYWGMKIVEISRDGFAKVLTPPGREYKPTAGSINTERFLAFEVRDSYSTAASWFFNTTGFQDYPELLANATLVFYLNKTIPLTSYKFYGDTRRVHGYEVFDLGVYYLFKVYADITGYGRLTVASYEDRMPPSVRVISMTPREPAIGRTAVVSVEAIDEGWGVERVVFEVRVGGATRLVGEAQRTMEPTQYRAIFKVEEPGDYEVLIRAVDLNGNIGETRVTFKVSQPETEKPPETPTVPPTTPTTPITPTTPTTPEATPVATEATTTPATTVVTTVAERAQLDLRILAVLLALAVIVILALALARRRF